MVDRAWFFTSYMFAFFAIYLGVILYSIAPTIMKSDIEWGKNNTGNVFVTEMNTTFSSTASSYQMLPMVAVLLISLIVISLALSSFSMTRAVGGS